MTFEQYLFFIQWMDLKNYANDRGVLLFGDVPIFVAQDSAEVWSHRSMFDLQENGLPRAVAGVPPDYFSATGQYWGNPHYRWDRIQQDGFSWWVERVRTQLQLFDLIRIDHFRGFESYWEIPALKKIGEELDVQYVIEGIVRISKTSVRVSALLSQASSDRCLWAETYLRDSEVDKDVPKEVAAAIANEVDLKLQPAKEAAVQR